MDEEHSDEYMDDTNKQYEERSDDIIKSRQDQSQPAKQKIGRCNQSQPSFQINSI
jgi:hypothetical protein